MPSPFFRRCDVCDGTSTQIDDDLKARVSRDGQSLVLVNASGAIRLSPRETVRLTMFFVAMNEAASLLDDEDCDDDYTINLSTR